MNIYIVIFQLQINITVYHCYPPLATLTHKHLCINSLLELEMTKIKFSFKANPPPECSICIRVPADIGREFSRNREYGCLLKEHIFRKTNFNYPYSLLNKLWCYTKRNDCSLCRAECVYIVERKE